LHPGDEETPVGVEDREWYRDEPNPRRALSISPIGGVLIVGGVVAGLLVAGALHSMTRGSAVNYGGEHSSHDGPVKISLLPGLPGITIGGDGLYAKNAEQHRAIRQALVAGSGEGARALAHEHVISSFGLLEAILEQVGGTWPQPKRSAAKVSS